MISSAIASVEPIPDTHDPASSTARLRSVDLAGPAGRLEALLNEGAPHAPCAVLVCHPHPMGGGAMHNKVVYRAMKALNDPEWGLNWPVLRFNFRGVGLSQGRHDGSAESEDVTAAIDWLVNEYNRPVAVAGFSFGASMALYACCGHGGLFDPVRAKIHSLVALGLPMRSEAPAPGDEPSSPGRKSHNYHYPCLHDCTLPKLLVSGEQDQYAPAADLVRLAASAADPIRLVLLPGADHFFTGQLETMQRTLAGWMKEQLP